MLDDDDVDLGSDKTTDDASSVETLLDIKVRRGLVEHEAVRNARATSRSVVASDCTCVSHSHICRLDARHSDGKTLKLSSRQLTDLAVKNCAQLELVKHVVEVFTLEFRLEHLFDCLLALDGARNVIDILGLDQRLQVILEHLGEVVLQF